MLDEFATAVGWSVRPEPPRHNPKWRKVMSHDFTPSEGLISAIAARVRQDIDVTLSTASGSDHPKAWLRDRTANALRRAIAKAIVDATVAPEWLVNPGS